MVLPVPRSSYRAPKGGRTTVDVSVDTFQVDMLMKSVMQTVSPAGLAPFGETVADYLEERAVNRFAFEGDDASGNWPQLTGATERIRASMGYGPDGPINVRTSEMFEAVVYSAGVYPHSQGVTVVKPEPSLLRGPLREKLITAQQGRMDNPMIPGATTPPRPVLALAERDMVEIMAKLQLYIMARAATNLVTLGTL